MSHSRDLSQGAGVSSSSIIEENIIIGGLTNSFGSLTKSLSQAIINLKG